jgi:multiple sugar transport system ATP-binding protein
MSSEGSVEIKDLVKTYVDDRGRPTFTAVKNISLHIENGEFMVLVGPSGCGKSTTLRMVAGLEKITSGLDRDRSLDPQFERPIAGA